MKKLLLLILFFFGNITHANNFVSFQHRSILGEIISTRECYLIVKALRLYLSNPNNDALINQMIVDFENISSVNDQKKFEQKYKRYPISTYLDHVEALSCEKYKSLEEDYNYISKTLLHRSKTLR